MMKRSLNRLLFAFRYTFKHIILNPVKSLLLVLGFIGIFLVILIAFSMNDFFSNYYVSKLEEKYQDFDLIVDVSSSGETRFFSLTPLENSAELKEIIVDKAMFFEFDVLLETRLEERTYVHVFASSIEQFAKISNLTKVHEFTNGNEMIVTKSFAQTYDLEILDEVSLFAKETDKTFIIIDIVEDGKLFSEQSVFIDKKESLSFFLSSLSPSLAEFPPLLLANIYNTVYIDIGDSSGYDEVVTAFKNMTPYQNLEYTKTIDEKAVRNYVMRTSSTFSMILSVVLISILFVLQTTLLVHFNEKKLMFAQIHVLGGRKQFSFFLVFIEMMIFFFISFTLSIFITNLIINFGTQYLEVKLTYSLPLNHIWLSLLVSLILFGIVIIYYFKTFYQVSDIRQTKDQGDEVKFNIIKSVIIILLSIVFFMLLEIKSIKLIFGIYAALIQIAITIVFLFTLPLLLIHGVVRYLKRNRDKNLLYYHFSMMKPKKAFKHYLSISIIASLTIMLLVFMNGHMRQRSSSYQDEYRIDFMMTNIIKDFDLVYQEIVDLPNVENALPVSVFNGVYASDYENRITLLVSMDYEEINTYFNLDIHSPLGSDFNKNERLNILLPERYQKIYHLNAGDKINIYVNPKYGNQDFHISGFFAKESGNLAFTNILDVHAEASHNTIFVNAFGDREVLRNQLLDLYSPKMVAVIDVIAEMAPIITEMEKVAIYLIFILSIIIACFIISLINHSQLLYNQLKVNFARLFVIGYSKKRMAINLIKEGFILFFIFYVIVSIGYVAILPKLTDFGLLFGEYEPLKFNFYPMFSGAFIMFIIFSFQYSLYIIHILKIRTAEIIKSY